MKKNIYLAGGCFWGVSKYLKLIKGVVNIEVGYANGDSQKTSYETINKTNHVETVKVIYDDTKINLDFLLNSFYHIINPTSFNKQGNDEGTQYRTGIYYDNENDIKIIKKSISELQVYYQSKICIEVLALRNYVTAEIYHQDYLIKNPTGYCHIGKINFDYAKTLSDPSFEKINLYKKISDTTLKQLLTNEQYSVTQKNTTEKPFTNIYDKEFTRGIYVDITTGEPLFSSSDKYNSGCGWPSFSKPIKKELIQNIEDNTLLAPRTEVRSVTGNSHLGHVFNDGPKETGGLRYCINSASLKFIKESDLVKLGYKNYLKYLK